MTALVANRDALAKAICAVTDLWDEPLDEVHDVPQIVNALIASGAVIDASTLADDEAACDAVVMVMLDDGHTGFGDCRPVPASLDVTARNALNALAAALTERTTS